MYKSAEEAERRLLQGTKQDTVLIVRTQSSKPFAEGNTLLLSPLCEIHNDTGLQHNANAQWHFVSRNAWKPAATDANGAEFSL